MGICGRVGQAQRHTDFGIVHASTAMCDHARTPAQSELEAPHSCRSVLVCANLRMCARQDRGQ